MLQKTCLLGILLLATALAQESPQYQFGYNVGVFETQSHDHILMSSRQVGRSLDIRVQFEEAFEDHPKVAIATSLLDIEVGTPTGYTADVINVDHEGFTIRVTAESHKHINSIAFNWLATTDPQIFVEYIDTKELSSLKNHQHVLNVPMLGWDHETKPIATSFLIGASFGHGRDVSLMQKVTNIYDASIDIKFMNHGDAPVESASVCLVFSTSENAFTTGELGLKVSKSHEWISRQHSGLANVPVEFDIPSDLKEGKRAFLSGLTGFEAPVNHQNLRLNIRDIEEKHDTAELSYGTWSDSKLREIGFSAFVFQQSEQQFYGERCAVVFSEKKFKGDAVPVCKGFVQLSDKNLRIKSFYIPPGGHLRLYSHLTHSFKTYTETHVSWNGAYAFNYVGSEESEESNAEAGPGFSPSEEEGVHFGEEGATHVQMAHQGVEFSEENSESYTQQGEESSEGEGNFEEGHPHLQLEQEGFEEASESQGSSGEEQTFSEGAEGDVFGEETVYHVNLLNAGITTATGEESFGVGESGENHWQSEEGEAIQVHAEEEQSHHQLVQTGVQFGEEADEPSYSEEGGAHFGEEGGEDLQAEEGTRQQLIQQSFEEGEVGHEDFGEGEWEYDPSQGEWSYIYEEEGQGQFEVREEGSEIDYLQMISAVL